MTQLQIINLIVRSLRVCIKINKKLKLSHLLDLDGTFFANVGMRFAIEKCKIQLISCSVQYVTKDMKQFQI
jgi:hypothetical protein